MNLAIYIACKLSYIDYFSAPYINNRYLLLPFRKIAKAHSKIGSLDNIKLVDIRIWL